MLQRSGATGKFWHRRKHSVEIDTDILQDELNHDAATAEDANIPSISDATGTPSSSVQVTDAAQIQYSREEWAATRIQTAFRGFLVPFAFFFLSFQFVRMFPIYYFVYLYLFQRSIEYFPL